MWDERNRTTRVARCAAGLLLAACVTETTAPTTIDPSDIQLTIISGSGQTGTVGTTLPTALRVKATNSSNTALPNIVLSFEPTAGGGSMYTESVVTDGSGFAQNFWTLGPTAGTQSVEVRRIDPTSGSRQSFGTFAATATSAAAAKLVVVAGAQQDGYGGFNVTTLPTVQVTDQFGNAKSGASVTFTVGSGGGTVNGTSGTNVRTTVQSTAGDGTAKPTAWTLGGTPSINSLTASSGSLSGSPATFFANALFSVKAINTSDDVSCELRADGAMFCAGTSSVGELGLSPTATVVSTRMTSAADGRAFSSISGAGLTACGLTTSGDAYCWGLGSSGQLGNGQLSNSADPFPVSGSHKFKAISVGVFHVCAITTAGAAYCWGADNFGQLGNNTTSSNPVTVPVPVNSAQTFAQISAGNFTTCGVTTTGVGYCWGNNAEGEVGDGGREAAPSPELVVGNHVWRQISAGVAHTCGVTTANSAYCWGFGGSGRLGNGGTSESDSPALVSGSLAFQQIQAHTASTCALTTGGNAYCWGFNNVGQLGDGTTNQHLTPTLVPTGPLFASLGSSLDDDQCAVAKSGGPAWCWGNNQYGQLGVGTKSAAQTTPQRVLNP